MNTDARTRGKEKRKEKASVMLLQPAPSPSASACGPMTRVLHCAFDAAQLSRLKWYLRVVFIVLSLWSVTGRWTKGGSLEPLLCFQEVDNLFFLPGTISGYS